MKSKVAIYTSTRAEYGLMRPLIFKLVQQSNIEVRLFVTGTHFSEKFGSTINEIKSDFLDIIHYQVQHSINEDSIYKNNLIMAEALDKYSRALGSDRPDVALVLGDRFEALCFGLACASLNIPLVHLHGGELTFGAVDDKYRHCLTKLAEWHFVACETYRKRVIQLGEQPDNVFNVGSLGVDNALNLKLRTSEELSNILKISLPEEFYIFTYHPETNSADYGQELLKNFLKKLQKRLDLVSAKVIITGVNNDHGSSQIKQTLESFCQMNLDKAHYFESLGVLNYLSMVRHATAVLGNSSSGVLEAHSLKTPAVNIGARQAGREREESLIDLANLQQVQNFDFENVVNSKKSLLAKTNASIFGNGKTSDNITSCLVEKVLPTLVANESQSKVFFDLPS